MRALLLFLLIPTLAFSADWKPLPGIMAQSQYDASLVKREGDKVYFWVRNPSVKGGAPMNALVDCRERVLHIGLAESSERPDNSVGEAIDTLCKRWYELWK